jgi:hypothetical protein
VANLWPHVATLITTAARPQWIRATPAPPDSENRLRFQARHQTETKRLDAAVAVVPALFVTDH